MRVAAYQGVRRLALEVGSEGTRHILNGGSCLSTCTAQQHRPVHVIGDRETGANH